MRLLKGIAGCVASFTFLMVISWMDASRCHEPLALWVMIDGLIFPASAIVVALLVVVITWLFDTYD